MTGDTPTPGRRGRRAGTPDTRGAIIEAARAAFADAGYDGTSLRAVARRAGVDAALVHHYFAGKSALFAATVDVPVDAARLVAEVCEGPADEVGARMVAAFLTMWDDPRQRPEMVAMLRSAVSHEHAARTLREFLAREVFGRVAAHCDGGRDDRDLRVGLAAAQMIGLALLRYVIEHPPLRDADPVALVAQVGPTLQRYMGDPAAG